MNRQDLDPNDNFYHGSDKSSVYSDNPNFYQGYDNQSPDINPNNAYAQHKDPFVQTNESYPTDLYKEIRGRNIVNYDNFGFDPVSLETVRILHPNAEIAGSRDGRRRLITMLVIAAVVLAIGLIPLIGCLAENAEQNKLLNNVVSVDAQVRNTLLGNKMPEHLLHIKSYEVNYTYSYNGEYYHGTDLLTNDQLYTIGLTTLSSDNQGRIIRAYADSQNPSNSILIQENFIGRGFLMLSPFVFFAAVFAGLGIKRYHDCISGKTAVYINATGNKKYQRIH